MTESCQSKIKQLTFHSQIGTINKVHRVRCSCLTEVSCFVLFPHISHSERIHTRLSHDCDARIDKLSDNIYIVKTSLGNCLDHKSIINFEPVKQSLFVPVGVTRQNHCATEFNFSQMNLLRNFEGLNHSYKKEKKSCKLTIEYMCKINSNIMHDYIFILRRSELTESTQKNKTSQSCHDCSSTPSFTQLMSSHSEGNQIRQWKSQ